jgi:sec-independent protein translocase protein TatA
MLGNLNGWHLVIILVVVLLLFGATRLPALSKSIAQSMQIFRKETKAMKDDPAAPSTEATDTNANPVAAASTTAAPAAPASGTVNSETVVAEPENRVDAKP